jgi:rhamnosyltransferase
MKVSVVIPTLDGGPLFGEVLGRVMEQETDFPYEVLCLDSGSKDGTRDVIRRHGIRLIEIDPGTFNHGLTRNRGIAETSGELVALLVQDATPADGKWLSSLVSVFERYEGVAGAWSRQIPRPHCSPFLRDRLATWMAGRETTELQGVAGEGEFHALPPIERLRRIAFDDVSSMIRRDVWREHPYRERNFGEDLDWSKRVILDGWRIAFEPASTVIHSHDNSMWYEFRRLYCDHQNLRELVGLTLVSTPLAVLRQGMHGVGHYAKVVRRAPLPPGSKIRYGLQGLVLPFVENLGQYLGSHSRKWMTRWSWLEGIDRRLKRGI